MDFESLVKIRLNLRLGKNSLTPSFSLAHKQGLERKLEHTAAVQAHTQERNLEGRPVGGDKLVVVDNHDPACGQKGHGRHCSPSNQGFPALQPTRPL